MSNILVTGANGQLGNEMRLAAEQGRGNNWLFTDVAELDITNLESVMECVASNGIDVVVNCAAYTNVDKAEDDAATAELLNCKAVENLAIACKESGATLIHISTDYVFKGDKNLPCKEDEPVNPLGAYGVTKLNGERAIAAVGCDYLIFRTAWLYSKFGNNFVKTMIRLTGEKESLNVVFDQVGSPTFARDLAELIYKIIDEKLFVDKQEIYHFSNEGVCSWYDFALEIGRIAGHNGCKVKPCYSSEFPSKVTRPAFSVLDKGKVKREFGVEIAHWRVALERCMKEILETK